LQCHNFLKEAGSDKEQVLILPEQFINMIMLAVLPFMEHLQHSTPLPPELKAKLDGPNSCWTDTDGVLHDAGDQIIVPSDVSLQTEIIQLTHDAPHIRHPGIGKTVELVKHNYWWLML
jgi:hypothetical protein